MNIPLINRRQGDNTFFAEGVWRSLVRHTPFTSKDYQRALREYQIMHAEEWDIRLSFNGTPHPQKDHVIVDAAPAPAPSSVQLTICFEDGDLPPRTFCPEVQCTGVQRISLEWTTGCKMPNKQWADRCVARIDGRHFGTYWREAESWEPLRYSMSMDRLAHRDGYISVEAFCNHHCGDFKGTIIHWTPEHY